MLIFQILSLDFPALSHTNQSVPMDSQTLQADNICDVFVSLNTIISNTGISIFHLFGVFIITTYTYLSFSAQGFKPSSRQTMAALVIFCHM